MILDVIPNLLAVALVANDMLVIRPLPELCVAFFICEAFECGDQHGQDRVRPFRAVFNLVCRGRRPRRPVFLDMHQHMNVVRHDDIFFDGNVRVCSIDFLQRLFDNCSVFRKPYLRDVEDAVPYDDVGQNASFSLRADGHKIRAGVFG